jgi:hypothetical protein
VYASASPAHTQAARAKTRILVEWFMLDSSWLIRSGRSAWRSADNHADHTATALASVTGFGHREQMLRRLQEYAAKRNRW